MCVKPYGFIWYIIFGWGFMKNAREKFWLYGHYWQCILNWGWTAKYWFQVVVTNCYQTNWCFGWKESSSYSCQYFFFLSCSTICVKLDGIGVIFRPIIKKKKKTLSPILFKKGFFFLLSPYFFRLLTYMYFPGKSRASAFNVKAKRLFSVSEKSIYTTFFYQV